MKGSGFFKQKKSTSVLSNISRTKLCGGLIAALCLAFAIICLTGAFSTKVRAAGDLDEILLYEITVDVNEDATLHML